MHNSAPTLHAYDRLKASQGKMIESSAAAMQGICFKEVAEIPKNSTPEELADRRKKALKRKGPKILRDAWLAPLTLGPGQQGHSDKRGKIKADGETPSTRSATAILSKLGIADGMWCDLVWNFKKHFGRSRGAESPDNMREDAVSHRLFFQPGQKIAKECFANRK